MFAPSQEDVRKFFCGVYQKKHHQLPLEPLESLASAWMDEHLEYAAVLSDIDLALSNLKQIDGDHENPFLHLAMHLSISEQCSIDQPRGLRRAVERLAEKKGDLHAAHHMVMECLGQILQESQSQQRPPDGEKYVDLVMKMVK